jgi:hypothetical protein
MRRIYDATGEMPRVQGHPALPVVRWVRVDMPRVPPARIGNGAFQKRLAGKHIMAVANKGMFQTGNRVSESILLCDGYVMSDETAQRELAAMVRQRQHTGTPMTGQELLEHIGRYMAQGVDPDTLLEPPEVKRLWTYYLQVERFKVLKELREERWASGTEFS